MNGGWRRIDLLDHFFCKVSNRKKMKRNCVNSDDPACKRRICSEYLHSNVVLNLIDFGEKNNCKTATTIYSKLKNNIRRQQQGRKKWLENKEKAENNFIPIEFYCNPDYLSEFPIIHIHDRKFVHDISYESMDEDDRRI